MLKLLNELYARVIVSVVVGFLLASTSTLIQGPCTTVPPGENISRCVEFSKAVMHPRDLINNKQGSLADFAGTFAISSLVILALLSTYSQLHKRKSKSKT
jgi:hypothetical protein